jgi:hypothetical protein
MMISELTMKISDPYVLIHRPIEGLCTNVLTCHQCGISSGDWTIPYTDAYQCPDCYSLHFAPSEIFQRWSRKND